MNKRARTKMTNWHAQKKAKTKITNWNEVDKIQGSFSDFYRKKVLTA